MRVKELREGAGLSQEGLARAANVTLGTVRNIERGQGVRLATARAIAQALGVTLDDLLEQSA